MGTISAIRETGRSLHKRIDQKIVKVSRRNRQRAFNRTLYPNSMHFSKVTWNKNEAGTVVFSKGRYSIRSGTVTETMSQLESFLRSWLGKYRFSITIWCYRILQEILNKMTTVDFWKGGFFSLKQTRVPRFYSSMRKFSGVREMGTGQILVLSRFPRLNPQVSTNSAIKSLLPEITLFYWTSALLCGCLLSSSSALW